MKRKTLQEVMKMTLKQRFLYYFALIWGNQHFSGGTSLACRLPYISVWPEGRPDKIGGLYYLDLDDDIVELEKHLDKWL